MSDLPPPVADEVEPPVDTLIGKVLNGRFTVLERVGSGGMGRVYRAMQAPLDWVCALKVLNPSYSVEQDPAFAKRFFLEASVTSKLTHPNTITIFDYGRTDEGIFFIAMEYLQGRTLHQTLAAEGALPAARATHIARRICRALREAHALGIVHRDLKPANVMLLHHGDDEDFVKVLDFGLVKFFTDQPGRSPDESELTQGGVFLGSPTYMAPEQARNHADPRSDIYSLGVMLYHLLAGRPPFQGRAPVDIILKHVNEPPPPFRAELKVPLDVEAVVMRALRKVPADRFQTMDEFLEGLKRTGVSSASDVMSLGGVDSGRQRGMSGPISTPMAALPSVAVKLEDSKADSAVTTEPGRSRGPKVGLIIGITLVVGALVAGAVVMLNKPTPHLEGHVTPSPPVPAPPAPPPVVVAPSPPVPTPTPTPPAAPKQLRVTSVPAGATVQLGGQVVGKTPLSLPLDPDHLPSPFRVEVSAPGFSAEEVAPTSDADGWSADATLVKNPGRGPDSAAQPADLAARTPTVKKPTAAKPAGYKDDPYAD